MRHFSILLTLLILLFSFHITTAQQAGKHTISGTIRAKGSGESILRATVTVDGKNMGVTTNDYGFFSITLPDGKYTILISAIGWEAQSIKVDLHDNQQLPVMMEIQG